MSFQESFDVLADVVGLCEQAKLPIQSAFAFDCHSVDVYVAPDKYDEIVGLIFDGEGDSMEWKDEESSKYFRSHDGTVKGVRLSVCTILMPEDDAE